MDEKVKRHLTEYCNQFQWGTDEDTLIEVMREGKRIHRQEITQHRWYNRYQYVVEVDGMLIGYIDVEATGDTDLSDYDIDPSTICEMRPVEKTVVVYEAAARGNR